MAMHISPEISAMKEELISIRRDFHRHPELGFLEERSSAKIMDYLSKLGFDSIRQIAKTGVSAIWPGSKGHEGPCLAFRSDMDALSLSEENKHDYVSETPGVMHACGHDGHMAILLGFARWLSMHKTEYPGPIKLLFQPAEEGLGGARPMIEQGALKNPDVDCILGLHLWNGLASGKVGLREGPVMATSDEFSITVHGKGGHAAIPQQTIDAVVVAAHIVTALQTVVSRSIDPLLPSVVTIGRIEGGSAHNIIADSVKMEGTARVFDQALRKELPTILRERAEAIAEAFGAKIDFEWTRQYPPTVNDAKTTKLVSRAIEPVVSKKNIIRIDQTMGAEDMSYYLRQVPGCFVFLGAGGDGESYNPHHNPGFDFDEEVLPLGVAIFAACAENFFDE